MSGAQLPQRSQRRERRTPHNHVCRSFLPVAPPAYVARASGSILAMAAAIKAINAKIRSNKVLDYFCSTRMWSRYLVQKRQHLLALLAPAYAAKPVNCSVDMDAGLSQS